MVLCIMGMLYVMGIWWCMLLVLAMVTYAMGTCDGDMCFGYMEMVIYVMGIWWR